MYPSFLRFKERDDLFKDLFAFAPLAMLSAGIVAVYLPARRASATDPRRALRVE